MAKRDMFAQFRKGSGQAPQYGSLAPVPASATAKYVQSFDERAIMQEQPPKIDGGPKGNPKRDQWPTDGSAESDTRFFPKRIIEYVEYTNMRADNQVLVRETPSSKKADKNAWPRRGLRVYYDQAGEDLTT